MLTRPSQWDNSYYDSDEDYGYPSSSVFDVPQYYPSYGNIKVTLPRGSVRISQNHLLSVFPGFDSRLRYGTLDGYRLSDELARRLHKSRGIDYSRVTEGLAIAFRALRESEQGYHDFRNAINSCLRGALDNDGPYPNQSRGLFRSRSLFVIFSTLAKLAGSYVLASAVSRFLCSHQSKIISCEDQKHIASWGLSVMDLQNLVHPEEAEHCFRALANRLEDVRNSWRWRRYYDQRLFHLVQILESFYGGWAFRGRRPVRPVMYGAPRATTMPPPIIHRPPPLLLPPPMPLSTYAPSPPMELALTNPYASPVLEEVVDNIASNQAGLHNDQLQLYDNQRDLRDSQNLIRNHQGHQDYLLDHQDHRLNNQEHRQDYLENKIEDLEQKLQY